MCQKKLLIVDDNTTFCQVLSKAMNKKGFESEYVISIKEVLNKAKEFLPEYITLDLKLLDGSGLICYSSIKKSAA